MPSNSETVTNLKPLASSSIQGRRHRLDCSRMNVVRKHDRTGSRLFENPIANYRRAGPFPVERINVPKNDVVSEFVMDPSFFAFGNRSIRRPKQSGTFPRGTLNCVVGPLQLAANTFLRHLGEIGMRPTVARDFVAFLCSPRNESQDAPRRFRQARRTSP